MVGPCRKAKVHIKIEADFDIAPIQSHYVLEILRGLMKSISDLDRIDANGLVESEIGLNFIPVLDEDLPESRKGSK